MNKRFPLYLGIFALMFSLVSLLFVVQTTNTTYDRDVANLHAMATQNAENYDRMEAAQRNLQQTICNGQSAYIWTNSQGFASVNVGLLKDCKDHMSSDDYQKYMNAVLTAGKTGGFDFTSNSPFTVTYAGMRHTSYMEVLHSDNSPDIDIYTVEGSFFGFQSISFDCQNVGAANEIVICE